MKSSHRYLRRARVSGIGIALLALAGASVVNAAAPWRMKHLTARSFAPNAPVDMLATDSIRPADRAFLGKLAESTRQHLRFAEVGLSHAHNSEVRSHAQQLALDYRALNDALEALIRRKGGIAGAPVGGTSETYQKLVEKAGPEFDREFVRISGQATEDALVRFEQMVSDSKDADVRELAAAQLPVLRAHRTAITELKKNVE